MKRADSNPTIHQKLVGEEIDGGVSSDHLSAPELAPPEPATATDEIKKELKKIQRQNFITHCLLASTIAITLAWQLSEVSLILSFKDILMNPLKYLPGIIGKLWRKTPATNPINGAASFLGVEISQFPRLQVPVTESSDDEDEKS